jgi:hypothetical protein
MLLSRRRIQYCRCVFRELFRFQRPNRIQIWQNRRFQNWTTRFWRLPVLKPEGGSYRMALFFCCCGSVSLMPALKSTAGDALRLDFLFSGRGFIQSTPRPGDSEISISQSLLNQSYHECNILHCHSCSPFIHSAPGLSPPSAELLMRGKREPPRR